ncbi:peptidoglycan-binding protein LysM [Loigolactobacillus backii]|uniref:LysM peptidoglycan-binding domain-containing protein n=1 Tax=Loigolactobacillus backii TaxID=375175 RepID=UPI0007F1164D|nr:LysM domain-containing protein [Loigolactobacillus backii]ANK59572.1 peptidoglycan-binding protein LysM [Loigolactobacillus backii]ANK64566.1 peptidoglycan-binding protein LysM [Loigolactobacillus backii]ANK67039.1 peptidoglycan-binding protein LysM [Loigolactobacillus backii]OLF70715.1 peptidoglycan-binding protein LysM [Loigolactobacillus backii]PIO87683.1 peptidoglycan-binding protein LysM [Loigolactobacillus backii]
MNKNEEPNKKTAAHEERPWAKQFDNTRDDRGNVSRAATRKKDRGNATFVTILTIALLALAALPIGAWMIFQNQMNKPVTPHNTTAIVSSSKKKVATSKKTQSKKNAQASSRKKVTTSNAQKTSSVATTETSTAQAASSSEQVAAASSSSSSAASTSSSAASANSSSGSYVTVAAGQGVYRVAANNGLSVQELLKLNGLTSAATIKPGQQLRVK